MQFSDQAEPTFDRALEELKVRGHVAGGQLLVLVQSGTTPIWRQHAGRADPPGVSRGRLGGDPEAASHEEDEEG